MHGLAEKIEPLTALNKSAAATQAALTLDEEQSRSAAIAHCNEIFATFSAEERVAWSLENLPGQYVLSSSFGAQAAVSLHMVASQQPDIPVIFVDTGYLFPETYQFVDELTEKLNLNLQVHNNAGPQGPAAARNQWIDAAHGDVVLITGDQLHVDILCKGAQ